MKSYLFRKENVKLTVIYYKMSINFKIVINNYNVKFAPKNTFIKTIIKLFALIAMLVKALKFLILAQKFALNFPNA